MSVVKHDLPRAEQATGSRAIWVLVLASFGVFVVFLDTTIVNVAFETISRGFHTTTGRLSWVLNAYSLCFAAALIPAGRISDIVGRKRMFLVGLIGFAATSALCGAAPDPGVLIAGRALQAIFGALVLPSSIALVLPEFPAAKRHVAVSTWGSMGGAAAALGPTIGALLTQYASWRWVFGVNVPICAVIAAVGWGLLRETRDPAARGIPDPVEVLLVAAVPALLSFAIIEGPGWGWSNPWVIGAFAVAAALLPVFVWRTVAGRTPVMDPVLFRVRQFRLVNVATVLFGIAFYGMLLGNVIFLQTVWHYSVLRAALAMAPSPLLVTLAARFAGTLAGRLGIRPVLIAGALLYAVGLSWYALRVGPHPHWIADWLPGAVGTGLGIAMTLPVQSAAATQHLPPARFALGSAVNSSFRQLGAVLGISVFVAVLGTPTPATAVADFHRTWWVLVALSVAAGLVWVLPARRPKSTGDGQ